MNSSKKINPLFIVLAVLSVLLAIGMLTFAGPCVHEDGSFAKCTTASYAGIAAAVIAFVAAIAGMVSGNKTVRGAAGIVAALAGVFAAVSPGTILPLCMIQTMRCWTIMRPFALVIGVIICICGIVAAIGAFRKKAGQ